LFVTLNPPLQRWATVLPLHESQEKKRFLIFSPKKDFQAWNLLALGAKALVKTIFMPLIG
jgi:hypothetical protein